MILENSTQDIFRFAQLRGAIGLRPGRSLALNSDTELARELKDAAPSDRIQIAEKFLRKSPPSHVLTASAAGLIEKAENMLREGGSVGDLRTAVGRNMREYRKIAEKVSDILLASKFLSHEVIGASKLETLYRISYMIEDPNITNETTLAEYLKDAISLPAGLCQPLREVVPKKSEHKTEASRPDSDEVTIGQINEAMKELTLLAAPDLMVLPDADGTSTSGDFFSLNRRGLEKLSSDSKVVLRKLDLDPKTKPIHNIVQLLHAEVELASQKAKHSVPAHAMPASKPQETMPYIRDVGIADLLVVKQHLTGYERVDIAHIENIMAGEKKSRNHRSLERIEEVLTKENERTTENQTELETAERFELNKESSSTIKEDQQIGFGLTISGKYGPTVDFSSNLNINSTTSSEEIAKSASRYAKDVVTRSLEKVVERVRTEQIRRVIREQEETNLHELANSTGSHIHGTYQFVEKVYESQIFNYGIRQMFDFMVPEPASFIWNMEKTEKNLNLPPPPPTLESIIPTANELDDLNYIKLAALLGAENIEIPPPPFLNLTTAVMRGAEPTGDDSEEGQPRSILEKEITLPPGYVPLRGDLRMMALTDDVLTLVVTIGGKRIVWRPASGELVSVGSGHRIGNATRIANLQDDPTPLDTSSRLEVHVMAFETNSYTITIDLTLRRTRDHYRAWQFRTYEKLSKAYQAKLERYEASIADLKAQAEAAAAKETTKFGSPPSQNSKIIKAELKKHCISIVTRQRYDDTGSVQDNNPPYFDFPEAAEKGAFIRFFEQAFEWDQMQYVMYPYFWARKDVWSSRFMRNEVDQDFLEFLQAGEARVVVPVRPGFEIALLHYLETGVIWNGAGSPPPINSPLYVPIVTEIQERTGAPQGEIPVGEPWTTRVPTPLVILRNEQSLPKWLRQDPTGWQWQESNQ